jgi:ribosomal-protein-alanine N-acetyltransferase
MTLAFLGSENTVLRPLDRGEFCAAMFEWVNDNEATAFMATGTMPATMESIEKSYDAIISATNEIVLAIIDRKTDTYIGNVGFYQINSQTRSAEYRIFLGHNGFRGKGHGTEAAKLMIAYAFERLNLNKVWLGVNDANLGAIKSYEKAGFVREGVLRQEIYRNGRYYDAIRMSILKHEFNSHAAEK